MTTRLITALISALMLLASTSALAGPDEDLRDASKAEAARLRGEGWPVTRCMVGVRFFDNIVVSGKAGLEAGDRLITIAGTNVENLKTEQVSAPFSSIPPGASVPVTIERAGQRLDLQLPCGNLADLQKAYLTALDFAGAKKWPECVNALANYADDNQASELRLRCARVSRTAKNYPIQQWTDELYGRIVQQASYAPSAQLEVADTVLKNRIDLSSSTYAKLVTIISKWDDGKIWQSVQPDLAKLRRGAAEGVTGRLIDPQSAMIEMPYDFIYGTWRQPFGGSYTGFITCGTVNAKNRMGGYVGAAPFVAVMNPAGFSLFVGMDDPTNRYIMPVAAGCGELTKRLTYVGNTPTGSAATDNAAPAAPSMAQELAKLAELHASGALTDQEYAAAKARILTGGK